MRTLDLGYVMGYENHIVSEEVQVLCAMLVQKDSANALVNTKTKAAILFREEEMYEEKGEIYLPDFDKFTKEYYEMEYFGDDVDAIIEMTRLSYIVNALLQDPNYELSYSVKEQGQIRRKQMYFRFLPGYKDLLCIYNHDITEAFLEENRKAEVIADALELAQKASKAKSDFLVRLSTDLRSPIYSISTMVDYALSCEDIGQMREILMQIKRKSIKFSTQVNAIMNLSVIDKGDLEPKLKPLVLKSVLDEMADALEPLSKQKNRTLIIEVDKPKLPVIMMDPVFIKEGFMGLLINSIEYGNPGGITKLSISSRQIDEMHVEAVCVIADDGPGMTKEHVRQLGQEFFVAGQENRKEHDKMGLGLGIPLTRAFVDKLGGTMTVESELGVGTIVTIKLIVEKADVQKEYYTREFERIKNTLRKESFSRFRALVADDNELNRGVTTLLLRKIGIRVETAGSCQEVIERLLASEENYYNVVFMDVNMINLDGRNATMLIREQERLDLSDITIVGTTDYELRDERIRTLEAGMDYHIPFPLDEQQIRDILLRELFNLNPQKDHERRGFRIIK